MGLISFAKRHLARRVGVEHRQFYETTGTVLGGLHAACPRCGQGRLVADPAALDRRTCDAPDCGASVSLAEIAQTHPVAHDRPEEIAARERRQALLLFVAAEILVVGAAAWAIWADSWATLGGALLLVVVICATAVVARYRAWQVETGRLFERRAPFGDFLRAEAASVLGRR